MSIALSARVARRAYTSTVRDVLDELLSVWQSGGTAGVATVVRTIKSAPRQPGATMVVAPDGTVAGSVSGGCVEAAVYELANEVVATGRPELQRYGVTDDDAFAVGLTCGGIIDIFAEPMSRDTFPQLQAVADDIAAHRPTAVATVIAHPDPHWVGRRLVIGTHSGRRVARIGARRRRGHRRRARPARSRDAPTVLTYGPDGQRQDSRHGGVRRQPRATAADADLRRDRLRGGAGPAGRVPRIPGHGVRRPAGVRDRRRASRPPTRSSSTGPTATSRPRPTRARSTPAPRSACSPTTRSSTCPRCRWHCGCPQVGYIGVMGSRRTHDDRINRLREAGLSDAELSRLASPIGLDLGASTPEETAVSIAAEIIARRWGGGGRPLTDIAGRIHHEG